MEESNEIDSQTEFMSSTRTAFLGSPISPQIQTATLLSRYSSNITTKDTFLPVSTQLNRQNSNSQNPFEINRNSMTKISKLKTLTPTQTNK